MTFLIALYALVVAARPAPTVAQAGGGQVTIPPDTAYGCIACHADKRTAFVMGVHADRGIRCHDCHGGDPAATVLPTAHRGRFVGKPDKVAIVSLCGSCHSDPDRMRQYGLPSGQVAELRTSRHGQLLLNRRDFHAPTCTDCHDAHMILRPDDARASTYPTNIPATCARCHQDATLMARYGLPTDQFERFRRSAHGVALFDDQNFAAPSCVGCHGTHSALPPTVTEIANVCGRCHVLVSQAFAAGPHAAAARDGRIAGCVGCHGNHDTERVPAERIAATCGRCHAAGTRAHALGTEIEQDVVQATADLHAAEEAIGRLTRAGRETGDAQFRYRTALTAYLQIAEVQHNLDVERLEELTRRVRSISRDLQGIADVAEEHRWEHQLFLVPVWFFALATLALALLALRRLERGSRHS